ncbi:hypothetical protein CLV42_105336 [Chitinophaga ginsengisoli]|uniref:Uncharacterized protein n=2 Tax=Chitinophaga ginsengisoli TaxID=363837 RepID=A0A2P8GAI6_9BACT|nr:hypothetical protein CLV42_105336 [Chitinophaga ginsengisoli]
MATNMDKSVAAVTSFPLRSHPAVHPFQMRRARNVPQTGYDVVQRVEIKTGTDTNPDGVNNYDVPEMEMVNALYKKFLTFSKQDYPTTPRIEAESNESRINWSEENALGAELVLGATPLNNFWNLVMDFKKNRDLGAVNIKSDDGSGFSSAIYNQYGKTNMNVGNTDVMVYKHPEIGEKEEKAGSDKGVSYELAAIKFEEISNATEWNDATIAARILQFYQDGQIPDLIEEKGQRRNFGYLVTLMTVPESVRSVGTFPFGLIMLENIKNGMATAKQAFRPAEGMDKVIKERKKIRAENKKIKAALKKKMEEEGGGKKKTKAKKVVEVEEVVEDDEVNDEEPGLEGIVSVAPAYKDDIDSGGLYPPAYSGSKKPLNDLETEAETGELALRGNSDNKSNYYWNVTLSRFEQMLAVYLASHPEQLLIAEVKDDKEAAIDGVINHILVHFGVGGEITSPSTPNREIKRESNNILSSVFSIIRPSNEGGRFTSPFLLPEGGNLAKGLFEFGSGRKEEELPFTNSLYQTHKNTYERFGQSFQQYPTAPSSPTYNYNRYEEQVTQDILNRREDRKQHPEEFDLFGNDVEQRLEELKTRQTTFQITRSVTSDLGKSKLKRTVGERDEKPKSDNEELEGTIEKEEELNKRRKVRPPLIIRKNALIHRIKGVILSIMTANWQEEYPQKFVEDALLTNLDLQQFITSELDADKELSLGEDELKTIISQEVAQYYPDANL